ncbi:MAG: Rne/Rng family ribonuclease [Candidatus Velthaea sp.]
MPTDILISSDPWENRVAILEDGTLSEIYVEREEKVIGSIFKGKVQNVLPGMGASFVDIGLGRNAFLYVDDINKTPLNIGDVEITSGRSGWTINEKVNRGDDVLVQIVKEPRGLKGARISTNISLPGRYLILMPTGKYSGVSRKIESAEERNRLKGIMKAIRPEGMATVVRTAANRVSSAELVADLGVLIRMWHGILEQFKRSASPALLHKDMNLVYKAARDFITPEVENVYIDDPAEAENVRDFMRLLGPQYLERIKPYPGGRALFSDYKIDEELGRLMRPTVKLPSGGSIVIETTEALTVIDVNSGKFTGGKNLEDTIVRTNVEAAAEIARQVRLRDIGGIIVCDFIDMNTEGNRNKVIATLEAGLRKDRTRSTIQSFSPLGLLEFTRKRVGKDLGGQLRGACPTCSGLGTVMSPESVTISTFRQIEAHAGGTGEHVHIAASPNVAAQVEFWYEDELKQLAEQVGKPIDVRVDPAVHPEKPRVSFNGALPELLPIRVGDEFDVDLLNVRTPSGTSALAVVNGRLVEVENAANQAGNSMKIRIIDVDGDEILAEPRIPIAAASFAGAAAGEGKRKRRRGGRGRTKPLTVEEQTEELLELAEEAAKGAGARPAIGISTSEEAEVEKTDPKANVAAVAEDRATKGLTPPVKPAASVVGRGSVVKLPGESLSGALVMPGESLSGDRIARGDPPPLAEPPPVVAEPVDDTVEAEAGSGDNVIPITEATGTGDGTRRRRRRRRRGRGGSAEPIPLQPTGGLTARGAARPTATPDTEDDIAEDDAGVLAEISPGADDAPGENGELKRRRRRRRRRGRGAGEAAGQTPAASQPAVPDRHIFRVTSDGAAHATGQTAPKEPSRAIAPWNRRPGHVAVEAPPPSLTAPEEPAAEVKVTTPARRRRSSSHAEGVPDTIESTPVHALPAPPAHETNRATRTTTRRKAASAATVAQPVAEAVLAPPQAPVAAQAIEAPPPAAPARGRVKAPASKATGVKKSAVAKKATASKASGVKKTAVKKVATRTSKKAASGPARAVKKTPAAAKKAPAKKAAPKKTAAKKSTATRKKS